MNAAPLPQSVERAFDFAKSRTLARAILTAVAIFTAFGGLATVGLIGLHDFISGRISAASWWPSSSTAS